jgi:hypothetical protein
VHIRRQDSQRQAYREINHEGEVGEADNMPRAAVARRGKGSLSGDLTGGLSGRGHGKWGKSRETVPLQYIEGDARFSAEGGPTRRGASIPPVQEALQAREPDVWSLR